MLKKILLLFSFSFSCLYGDTSIWFGGGFRQDSLNWNIAGPNNFPNVLSELEWNDIQMLEITGGISGYAYDTIYYRLSADYGKIYNGRNRDSDFIENDRNGLFSQSDNDANDGEAYDISIGLGYPFNCFCNNFTIVPLVGYAYMAQHLQLKNGFQTVNLIDDFIGPFPGLHSHYQTAWNCGWLGLDMAYTFNCDFTLFGSLEYYFGYYDAEGDWNLRPEIDHFTHTGYGHGPKILLGAEYEWNYNLGIAITFDYRYLKVRNGTDRTYFNDSYSFEESFSSEPIAELKLNGVNWHSFRMNALLTYEF